jgi:hypothetical protein
LADYNQNIKVTASIEQAERQLRALEQQLEALTRKPINLFSRAPGASAATDAAATALKKVQDNIRAVANSADNAAQRVTLLGNTVASTAEKLGVFKQLVENVKLANGGLTAQEAAVKNLGRAWAVAATQAETYEKRLDRLKNDALREAKGLQPQDVRDYEVYKRKNDLQSGRFKQKQAAQQVEEEATLQDALLKMQGRSVSLLEEKLGILRKITNETTLQAQRARDGLLDGSSFPIRPQRTVAGVRAMGFPIALPETAQDRKFAARDAERAEATRSLALQKSNSLNAKDISLLRTQLELIKALAPAYEPFLAGLKKANDRQSLLFRARANRETRTALGDENIGRRDALDEIVNKTNRSLVARNKLYEIGSAIKRNDFATAKALGAEADLLIKKEQNYNGVIQRRLAFRRQEKADAAKAAADAAKQQKAAQDLTRERLEGVAIGGAFPLLFGGGAGSVIGGALGGLNTGNPIFSVFTSAIGQMLDQFAAAAQDTGKALRDPITNFQKIADAGLLASKSQEYYISRLIEVGRITEATAVIQGEMVKKIGVTGVNDLTKLGESSDKLAKAWAELNLQMQAALAGPLAGLLDWITSVVKVFGDANRSGNAVQDILKGLNPQQQQAFQKEMLQNNARYGTSPKAFEEEAKIMARYRAQAKPQQLKDPVTDPKALEAARKAAQQLADQIQSAYREAFDLQRRGADIQREMVDYRRKVESDIFAKTQEAKRLEIDNARKGAQINIEQTDLALRKQFSGSQGLTAELLNGVREYISARRSGEADIEQKRRQLEVNLADLTKTTADYAYEQANRRMQLERSIEDYKRSIADYQLKVARQIQDLAPIGGGAAGGGAPVGNLGGFAGLSKLIGGHESYGGNYGAFNRGGSNNGHTAHGSGIDPNLVNMTIAEIQRRQLAPDVPRNQQLHAVGKYQIIGSTLRSLLKGGYGPTGVKATDKFSPETQEKLGAALARNRIVPGNVDATVRGLRQEWIGLQYANTPQLRAAAQQFMGAPGTQLGTAASSAKPPEFKAPAANTAGFADAQSRVAEAQKKSVELEKQSTALKQQAAAFAVEELARGQSQVEQTRQQLELEKGKLGVITTAGSLSENQMAQMSQQLEGQSKIAAIVTAQKDALLAINTAVKDGVIKQVEADELIKQINTGVEKRLEATREQIKLEQELLKVQQAQQLALEAQTMQRQLANTGKGIMAGFTGGASGKYDDILGRTGNSQLANKFAQAQQVLDRLLMAQADAEAIGGSIAGGFKEALKAAVTGGDIGAAFANLFGGLGDKFLEMAFRPIEQMLTQAVFGMMAPSNAQIQAAQMNLLAAQQMLTASTNNLAAAGSGGGGFGGAGGLLGGLFSLFGGGGLGAAASGIKFNPIAFRPGLSFFAEGGFVTGPTRAILGEGGEPEVVLPQSKIGAAMSNYRPGSGAAGLAQAMNAPEGAGGGGSIDISYSVTEINSMRFVTEDQFQQGMAVAAKRGASGGHAQVMGDLRNKRSVRSRMGMA